MTPTKPRQRQNFMVIAELEAHLIDCWRDRMRQTMALRTELAIAQAWVAFWRRIAIGLGVVGLVLAVMVIR